jgi:hypothetical protein
VVLTTFRKQTVALGYSRFCNLFTQGEWEGFNYAIDLEFYYSSCEHLWHLGVLHMVWEWADNFAP